jgi:polysaccharide export outer membrane protein
MSQKMIGVVFAILLLLMISGCKNGKSDYTLLQTEKQSAQKSAGEVQTFDYRILPQDRLKVSIYRDPVAAANTAYQLAHDMQKGGLVVNAQGYITLPLLNRVKVAGLTQTQAADRLTSLYKKYLKVPTVYVEVLNKRVYVIGEVNKPGPVELDREKLTLLEAVAYAGDLTDSAVRDNILIISRNEQNRMYMRSVDLTHFDHLSFSSLMLKPNDIVYVQPDGWKEYKVKSDKFTTPFKTIAEIAQPFVTLKYLENN